MILQILPMSSPADRILLRLCGVCADRLAQAHTADLMMFAPFESSAGDYLFIFGGLMDASDDK
jgi:hypothetical protein